MSANRQSIRRGVVAVVTRAQRFLVIRRSRTVAAPGAYCFPGGGMETDESEAAALIRELREELDVEVRPERRLWQSITPWRLELAWWRATLADSALPRPNPDEVESVHWLSYDDMLALPELLESNRQFLAALTDGRFVL